MAELERIYADYKAAPEQAMFICIGEMDQLSELHRLLYESGTSTRLKKPKPLEMRE
jgi:hypothetical protein